MNKIEMILNILGEEVVHPVKFSKDENFNSLLKNKQILSVKYIYDLTKNIDIELIKPIFKKVFFYNTDTFEKKLKEKYKINIGEIILKNIYGNENQAITESLPIIKFAAEKSLSEEEIIRGLFIFYLISIHIKTSFGKLTLYRSSVFVSAGVAASLTYLHGGNYEMVCDSIVNILNDLSGVHSVLDATMLALNKEALKTRNKLAVEDIEETIKICLNKRKGDL